MLDILPFVGVSKEHYGGSKEQYAVETLRKLQVANGIATGGLVLR